MKEARLCLAFLLGVYIMRKLDCSHQWCKVEKGDVVDICSSCNDVFPCRESCGHIDCHLEKSRNCNVCGEVIHGRNNTLYFVDGPSDRVYLVHEGCADFAYYVIL